MSEEEQDDEKLKQTIIKNLFEKGTIRKVTTALFIRCGLNPDTGLIDDIVAQTFLEMCKMKPAKLIKIATTSNNYLDRYMINLSKNVGIRRSKEGYVSKQKIVEYMQFASALTSVNVINPYDEYEASYSEDSTSANIILVVDIDENTKHLLFEQIKENASDDEMQFIESMLQKKHKKTNIERDKYLFLIEKLKLKIHNKMKDKEQEIKQLVINIIPSLYNLINTNASKTPAAIAMDIQPIMLGRMTLGHIPYDTLLLTCDTCVREYIYSIISWYESPAFQPTVVDEDVREIDVTERTVNADVNIIDGKGNSIVAPDGEYELSDGFKFNVTDGKISTITNPPAPAKKSTTRKKKK